MFLLTGILAFVNPVAILERLNQRLSLYNAENPFTHLFLHLDKSTYSQNEDIWFKAYILDGKVIDNKVLYVRITDEKKQVMIAEQFPVYDIRSHGDILLPDTLKDGNYYLYAYTDRMINFKEEDIFVQAIKVQRNVTKRLEASASVTDTANIKRGQPVQVVIKLKEGIHLQKGVRGNYELIDDKKVLKSARITTNNFGEAEINFTYPQIADDRSLKVRAVFNRNSDFAELELNLRHESNPVRLKIFPEGGNLIPGFNSRIVVEASDINKYPVSTELSLLENGREIRRFKTNHYGTGTVLFKPIKGATYSINYIGGKNSQSSGTPVIIEEKGYSLSVSQERKRLTASVKNQGENGKVVLGFRTLNEVLQAVSLTIPPGDSVNVPFIFKDMPKDVVSVFLLDEGDNIKCERLILNKSGEEDYTVKLSTEQKNYGSRKKVLVNLEVTNQDGNPVASNLSVAVVEKSRIDPDTYRTILNSYYYRFLEGRNCKLYIPQTIEKDIDDLLITKHWLHSGTKEFTNYISRGPLKLLENTGGITGTVKSNSKRKVDLQKLVLISKEKGVVFDVAGDNTFSIKPESLTSSRGNKWTMKAGAEFFERYTVSFNNYEREYDKRIAKGDALYIPTIFNVFDNNKPADLTKAGSGFLLKTVELKGKSTDTRKNAAVFSNNVVGCEAYICRNNILNCENHPTDGYPPEEGKVYSSRNGPVVYRCRTSGDELAELVLKNIILPKPFPLTDFEKENINTPAVETTLYWNPNFGTNSSGKNSFSFFTNDVKGDFFVIAQGLDINNLRSLFGKAVFSVK